MSMTAQKQNVPTLRFPEFSTDWDIDRLDNYISRVGIPVSIELEKFYREIGIRSHGRGIFHKEPVTGKSLGNKRVFKVHIPAFVVNIVFAWEHAIAVTSDNEEGFIASHRFPMFVPVENKATLPFVRNFFIRKYGKHLLGLASPGGAGRNKTLGQKDFAKLKVIFPDVHEQQKIASFLTSVDTKIEQLGKKKALFEQYKKGMLQKLFSQQIRFKDDNGNDFPDWKKKPLDRLYEFKSTNSLSRDQLNFNCGEVRNIHYGDIHKKFKPRFDMLHEDVPFINSDVNLNRISEDKYCKEGDLVIADASEDYNDIGKTIELSNLRGEKVLAGLHTLLARLLGDDLYVGFGAYLMASESVRKQIKLIAQGTKVLSISTGRMCKIKLSMPTSTEEQKRIANFLSSLDQKTDLIATELNQTKIFKKGLLQQMFV